MKSDLICGLDEVGRGAFAGPLVAAAVILYCPPKKISSAAKAPIRDSKKLSSSQRLRLFQALTASDCHISIASISVKEINQFGLGWANRQIFLNLIKEVQAIRPSKIEFIVDGNLKLNAETYFNPGVKITCLPKADQLVPQVSLASIVAKEVRDNLMKSLHLDFPEYLWYHNVGYGTQAHIQALLDHGLTPHHRIKFVKTTFSKY